jgi:hypothetical protein
MYYGMQSMFDKETHTLTANGNQRRDEYYSKGAFPYC